MKYHEQDPREVRRQVQRIVQNAQSEFEIRQRMRQEGFPHRHDELIVVFCEPGQATVSFDGPHGRSITI